MMNCNCNSNTTGERAWVGTGLKFAVTITAEGFSMDDDDWKVVFQCGRKSVEVTKADASIGEDDTFFVNVDTSLLGAGTLTATTYAYIPDEDWEGGIRTEVDKQELLFINEV